MEKTSSQRSINNNQFDNIGIKLYSFFIWIEMKREWQIFLKALQGIKDHSTGKLTSISDTPGPILNKEKLRLPQAKPSYLWYGSTDREETCIAAPISRMTITSFHSW